MCLLWMAAEGDAKLGALVGVGLGEGLAVGSGAGLDAVQVGIGVPTGECGSGVASCRGLGR